jgi:hypothetical protein
VTTIQIIYSPLDFKVTGNTRLMNLVSSWISDRHEQENFVRDFLLSRFEISPNQKAKLSLLAEFYFQMDRKSSILIMNTQIGSICSIVL